MKLTEWIKGRLAGNRRAKEERAMIMLEQEPTQKDVRSFFAKLDEVERNVPVAMIATWKQMAAEQMAAVKSAEEFAFEQGRLSAFCEMEKAFLDVARSLKAQEPETEEE